LISAELPDLLEEDPSIDEEEELEEGPRDTDVMEEMPPSSSFLSARTMVVNRFRPGTFLTRRGAHTGAGGKTVVARTMLNPDLS